MNIWIVSVVVSIMWCGNSFGMLAASRAHYPGCAPRRSFLALERTLPPLPESMASDDEDELKKAQNGPDADGNFKSLSAIYNYLKENPSYRGAGEVLKDGLSRFRFRVFESCGEVCVAAGS